MCVCVGLGCDNGINYQQWDHILGSGINTEWRLAWFHGSVLSKIWTNNIQNPWYGRFLLLPLSLTLFWVIVARIYTQTHVWACTTMIARPSTTFYWETGSLHTIKSQMQLLISGRPIWQQKDTIGVTALTPNGLMGSGAAIKLKWLVIVIYDSLA